MIPSRPLALVELITESFSIFWRTSARYGVLFLLLIVPGVCLVTAGSTQFTEDFVTQAKHNINFGDSDLTAARNDFNAFVTEQNPALQEKLPGVGGSYPHANTRQLYYFLRSNIGQFSSSIDLLASGLLLLTIGIFALTVATVDLASQIFEERDQELFGSLRSAFVGNLWKMLMLYTIYLMAVFLLDGILGLLPASAAGALSGFTLVAQIYTMTRLVVTVPAMVSEEIGPFRAVARSWELTRRFGGRILGASLVGAIVLFVVCVMAFIAMQFIFSDFSLWWNDFLTRDRLTLQWLLESSPGAIRAAAVEMTVLFFLFGSIPIFGTVLYYDLRTRHDGPLMYVDEPS